jgi:FAD-linked sulfhydryl oxidase
MADQWIQEAQRQCTALVTALDGARRGLLARLPAPQPRGHPTPAAIGFFGFPSAPRPVRSAPPAPTAAAVAGVTREDIGRATWLFLHTLAAQYPVRPTRRQRKDAAALMDILTRMYPCGECARHFSAVVAANPPKTGSKAEFSRWMCDVHNVVNRSLGKPTFNCDLVEARWAGVECDGEGDDGSAGCSIKGW